VTRASPLEVRLRKVTDDDLTVFFAQQQDPEANRMAAFPARDRDTFTAHWAKIRADPSVTVRTVVADGCIAGNIVRFEAAGKPLVGYWIGREFWGRGIATRALGAFVREVRMRPLYARVASHNAGSIRVLEKCGFVRVDEGPPAGGDDGVIEFLFELAQ
jgi:RimJ/RimL family protein N-acetyltransferase